MNRYFELHDAAANHHKFWEIIQGEADGKIVNVHFGRIGTSGQTQVKTFPTKSLADDHVHRLIREKRNKGYVEQPYKASGTAAMAPLPRPAPKPEAPPEPTPEEIAVKKATMKVKRHRTITVAKKKDDDDDDAE